MHAAGRRCGLVLAVAAVSACRWTWGWRGRMGGWGSEGCWGGGREGRVASFVVGGLRETVAGELTLRRESCSGSLVVLILEKLGEIPSLYLLHTTWEETTSVRSIL